MRIYYVGESRSRSLSVAAAHDRPYRRAGDDELLQMTGLVSYSLLQQEDPTALSEALTSISPSASSRASSTAAPAPETPRACTARERIGERRKTKKGPDG